MTTGRFGRAVTNVLRVFELNKFENIPYETLNHINKKLNVFPS